MSEKLDQYRKKWLVWAAVSSLPQAKKISNENQLQLGREHAAKWGGVVVDELVVPGESRSIILFEDACRRIAAYDKLRQHIEQRDFDVLAFYDRSRIGRTASLSITIAELCAAAGIACYELESPPQSIDAIQTYTDKMIGAMKSVGAQNEVEKLKERRRTGMMERALKGKMPAKPSFGYKYDITGKNIIVDEPAASVVRRVCELYLLGRGAGAIADTVNVEFGIKIYRTKVSHMLDSINIYAGYAEFNAYSRKNSTRYRSPEYVKVKAQWQPIISEDVAEQIKSERRRRSPKNASENQCYLLSGVCHCATCDKPMYVSNSRKFVSKYTYAYTYIRCRSKHKKNNILADHIVNQFRGAMERILANKETPVVQDEALLTRLRETKQAHEAALQKLTQSKKRADDAYVDGIMDADTYKAQIERIRTATQSHQAQIVELDGRIDSEANRTQYAEARRKTIAEVVALLDSTDVRYANLVLRNNFRIYIADGDITEITDATI